MTKAFEGEGGPTISVSSDTENSGAAHVASSLAAEIAADFGPRDESPLSIVAREGDTVVGGLNGSSHWGWCYIRHLWVHPDWRRRGLGYRLVAEAEALARARRCAGLYVDTFNDDAVRFYKQAGFACIGRIENFPPGHARTFLAKNLD
jgi:ribosomal protein S18 acetylase RimI-like enzyme